MTRYVVAKVIVDVSSRAVDRFFDYLVPAIYTDKVEPGWRVYVSFGNRFCQGYVMAVETVAEVGQRVKPILALLGDEPILTAELVALVEWVRYRYACTYLDAILAMVPGAFRVHKVARYVAKSPPDAGATPEQLLVWQILDKRSRTLEQLLKQFGPDVVIVLEQLRSQGWVDEVLFLEDGVKAKTMHRLELNADVRFSLAEEAQKRSRRAPKQARLLLLLQAVGSVQLEEEGIRPSDAAVQALVRDGFVRIVESEVYRALDHIAVTSETQENELTSFQSRALQAILAARDANDERSVLLFGVTGSGKTEVYLQAIAQTVALGQGAIVLVPEISLTPQMVGRFTQTFGRLVAVLHSGLSDGERRDEWLRILRGQARIVIGARSAVFAPVAELRLIIVDEEHEPSYKQEESPRYDARQVARWRTVRQGGVTVYGSATPSLKAMVDVEQGRSRLASLPFRVHGRPLPPVTVVDMREELRFGNHELFSRALRNGLEETIMSNSQAILFLNRRGYAAFMLCRSCGETVLCPHCDISLTLHKSRQGDYLECHYCGFHTEASSVCPTCKEEAMRSFGVGTQQVEQYLHDRWPDWRVLRMDVDTTRRKGAHQQVVQAFMNGEADILLGTQMVAKGLDFPNVAFVGVVAADTMLSVPDYRSAERTFNLLTQVSGRSGRAHVEGRTVIQTYQPEHYAIVSAAAHDYQGFYQQERELRAAFRYPPFCELGVFVATHSVEAYARGAAQRFERELKRRTDVAGLTVLPAVPAGVKRVDDRFRYQVVVKYDEWDHVQEAVLHAYQLVAEKMRQLGGTSSLDVNAGRI